MQESTTTTRTIVMPTPTLPQTNTVNLTCPINDDTVHVTLTVNPDWSATGFAVMHALADGRQFDRASQYLGAKWGQRAGSYDYAWYGTQARDPRHTMIGNLFKNDNGWFYREASYYNGAFTNVQLFPCY